MDNEGYDELSPLLRRLDVQQQQIRSRTAELKRRQADFAAVTDSMGEGLVLLGREDAVLSINPAACRLLECTATTGRDILEVNRSPELRAVLAQAHEGKRAEVKPASTSFSGSAASDTRMVSPMPSSSIPPMPMPLLSRPIW